MLKNLVIMGCSFIFAVPVYAAEVIEQFDRFEVNWSTLRLRYYGEASGMTQASPSATFRDLEQGAWQEGLRYAASNLPEFYQSRIVGDTQEARAAAERVTRSTYSYNTVYFADGSVRVLLENLLPRTVVTAGKAFKFSQVPDTEHLDKTGVVLRVRGASKPHGVYEVVADNDGRVIFSVTDVAEEAFRQNLMGRWFMPDVTARQLEDAVGKQLIEINATMAGDGRIAVNPEDWLRSMQGYESLLAASRIALIIHN